MNEQVMEKKRQTRPNGSAPAVMAIAPAAGGGAPPPPPPSTIQISYPTPTVLANCPQPFRSVGTAAQTTVMNQTALIYTPTGILVGTRDANAPPPFTWSYTFNNCQLPQGVPLSIVVSGVTNGGAGNADHAVVPFQCN